MCVLMAVLALSACKEKKADKPPTTTEQPAPKPSGLAIYVNQDKVVELDAAKVAAWPRLDSLLPQDARRYGTWTAISGIASAGPFEIKKPGATYGALVPAVYVDAATKAPSLGLFDPVDLANKSTPKVMHVGLSELRVSLELNADRGQNDHQGGEVADLSKLQIEVQAGGKSTTLSSEKLLALPREAAPDDTTGEHKGWTLAALLAAAEVKSAKRVLLTGEELNLTLEEADLDPKLAVPFIKLNRQGALRFRTYRREGTGWTMGGDLRGLKKIQVLE